MTQTQPTEIPLPRFELTEVKTEKQFATVFPVLKQLAAIEMPECAEKMTADKSWAQYQSARKQGYRLFAAETSLEIIGAIGIRICDDPLNDGKPYAIINNLVVDEDFRSLGIGTDMLARAEVLAKKEGCSTLFLGVLRGNKKSKNHYEDNGYSAIADWMIKEI